MIFPIAEYHFFNCRTIHDVTRYSRNPQLELTVDNFNQVPYFDDYPYIKALKIGSNDKAIISNIYECIRDEFCLSMHFKEISKVTGDIVKFTLGDTIIAVQLTDDNKINVRYGSSDMEFDYDYTKDQFFTISFTIDEDNDNAVTIFFRYNNEEEVSLSMTESYNDIGNVIIGNHSSGDLAVADVKIYGQRIDDFDYRENQLLAISDLNFRTAGRALSYRNVLENTAIKLISESSDVHIAEISGSPEILSEESIQEFDITPLNPDGATYMHETGIRMEMVSNFQFEEGYSYCIWVMVKSDDLEYINSSEESFDYLFKLYNTDGWYVIGKKVSNGDTVGTEYNLGLDYNADTKESSVTDYSLNITVKEDQTITLTVPIIDAIKSTSDISTTIHLQVGGLTIIEARDYPNDIYFNTTPGKIASTKGRPYCEDEKNSNSPDLIGDITKCTISEDVYSLMRSLYILDNNASIYVKNNLFTNYQTSDFTLVAIFKLDEAMNMNNTITLFKNLFNYDIILRENKEHIIRVRNTNTGEVASLDYTTSYKSWLMVTIISENVDNEPVVTLSVNGGKGVVTPGLRFSGATYFNSFDHFTGKVSEMRIYPEKLSNQDLDILFSRYISMMDEEYFQRLNTIITIDKLNDDYYYAELNDYIIIGVNLPQVDNCEIHVYKKEFTHFDLVEHCNATTVGLNINKIFHITKNMFVISGISPGTNILKTVIVGVERDNSLKIYSDFDKDANDLINSVITSNVDGNEFYINYDESDIGLTFYKYRIDQYDNTERATLQDTAVLNEIALYYYSQVNDGSYMPYDFSLEIATPEVSGQNYTLSVLDATAFDKAALDRSKINKKGDDQ